MGLGGEGGVTLERCGRGNGRLLERLRVTRRILREHDGAGEVGRPRASIVQGVLKIIQVGHAGRDVAGKYEKDLCGVRGCGG